ncbi:hypothetical protein D9619_000501 [Psilocybe cf. subviscida]|uniref:arginyltransferase n=1 Tax=Psilocybe cf. subviscida TaxID=2480587 RepID=A0A8H5BF83_9AGAR|nr:hypothetical protein D9619_000501 [Psilocybe cf. subviscida]
MTAEPGDNVVIAYEPGSSSCGYCSPQGQRSEGRTSFKSGSLHAIRISCDIYQRMIDRGWRRSGTYCYKPNLKLSCCPQYTIKLDAKEFTPSRSQRQPINRWNRFVIHGDSDDTSNAMDVGTSEKPAKPAKAKKLAPFTTLAAALHESELSFMPKDAEPAHTFSVNLEPAAYSAEKLALYRKYQSDVHKDHDNSPKQFKGFLVESPLEPESIEYPLPAPSHLPKNYGSYHQLYRLDGQLIAMGVIDILPGCVSSVYFMYDTTWERFSLGKAISRPSSFLQLSALREVSLAREMQEAGAPQMGYLYMGFYIYSCPKMRYKGEYAPSYLADPETYEWFPLGTCIPIMEKNRYACFSTPSHSDNDDIHLMPDIDNCRWWTLFIKHPLLRLNPISSKAALALTGHETLSPDADEFDDVHIMTRGRKGDFVLRNLKESGYLVMEHVRETLSSCVLGLGTEIAKEVTFAIA